MGRPSLRTIRREELLDAVVGCITTKGVAGVTVADVAKLAGTQPSKVHHYLGSRDEMISAAIERALASVEEIVIEALQDTDSNDRLDAQLRVLFGVNLLEPRINQLVDHLVAASYLDDDIRVNVGRMYQRFLQILVESIELAIPSISKADCHQAAHTILALAHSTPTFEWLALESNNLNHGLTAAEHVVSELRTKYRG